MNRRQFLALVGLAAPALALDPERLLWVPGAKRIFLPPATVFDPMTGISIRFIREYQTDRLANRFDVLYGWGTVAPSRLSPEQIVRIVQ
jgi:hypothetical protein